MTKTYAVGFMFDTNRNDYSEEYFKSKRDALARIRDLRDTHAPDYIQLERRLVNGELGGAVSDHTFPETQWAKNYNAEGSRVRWYYTKTVF